MKTLAAIKQAIESLSSAEKQELLLFLATRLRNERDEMPPARRFGREQIGALAWADVLLTSTAEILPSYWDAASTIGRYSSRATSYSVRGQPVS
jgi:hypothetical protein